MPVLSIPESYLDRRAALPELMVYDFRMTEDVIKSKVQLSMHMFSFLRTGRKVVHIADSNIAVNPEQSLLVRNGNALWTELPDRDAVYCCKLLFFSEAKLRDWLKRHPPGEKHPAVPASFFVIENDPYLQGYIQTLDTLLQTGVQEEELLQLKFDEILIYLQKKYGPALTAFLHSLAGGSSSGFRQIVESHVQSALKVREIAFLCNMSLSSFKRHFIETYGENPGKWYKDRRLEHARELLAGGEQRASEIYLDFGYSNLSNFSAAFKQKFGVSPRGVVSRNGVRSRDGVS